MNQLQKHVIANMLRRQSLSNRWSCLSIKIHHDLLRRDYFHCFLTLQKSSHQTTRSIQKSTNKTTHHSNMIQNHTNSPHHHLTLQQLQEFPNIENKKIIPLLISPFQTDRILHEHLSQQPIVSERSEHSKRIWLAHDQTKVHTLINLMFNQPLNSDTKSNIIVFEGTYHNMLELYQSLKRRLSGYLNLKHEKKKSLKEKYLESHLSKLEFTDMISRFGILGRVELDHDKKENGEYSKSYSFIQTKVKRLPKLETLNRLAQFTIEKAEKIDPLLNGAYIFIPIHSLLSSIKSMDQWEKNGIQISLSEKDFIDIYPQFGVYSPTRREIFSTLIRNACEEFLKNSQMLKQMNNINIIDIGCGTVSGTKMCLENDFF